jgi:molybdopterin-containing oxidoreductase family iron-sulfur binding subunit
MPNEGVRDVHAHRMSRRKMMKGVAAVLGALAIPAKEAPASVWDAFFQKNFREMSKEELDKVLARLEKEYGARYGKAVKVKATPPIEGVLYGYGLDLSCCIGCRRCV